MKKKNTRLSINQQIIYNLRILQDYEKINNNLMKIKAYQRAIENVIMYNKQFKSIRDIENMKGISIPIKRKIIEYFITGKIHSVQKITKSKKYKLGKKLLDIYAIGPVKIKEVMNVITDFDQIYNHLDLLTNKQKIGLKYYYDFKKRIPLSEAKIHYNIIKNALGNDIEFSMAGSYRRKTKTIGDIDILIKDNKNFNLKDFINKLKSQGYLIDTLALSKKYLGVCKISENSIARRIDINIAKPDNYYFTLLYLTGSYTFNIYIRKIAQRKGLSLSEYGFKDNIIKKHINTSNLIHSEKDIFKFLGIPYIPPEKR